MSPAIAAGVIGRSMSPVRPWPCSSTPITWCRVARVGMQRGEVQLDRQHPAVQQYQRRSLPVGFVVHVQPVDIGVRHALHLALRCAPIARQRTDRRLNAGRR